MISYKLGNGKIKLNMKLIYLHQYFNFPEYSGGTRSYDLSREFVKKGVDVTVNGSYKTVDLL